MNTKSGFKWLPVVAVAAPLGLLFAALTISGALPGASSTKWVALGLIVFIGAWVAVRVSDRRLIHGFVAGFLAGLVAIETQAMFIGTYFDNNPQYADLAMPFDWSPRLATAVLGPLNAILSGVIAAAIAWTVGAFTGRFGKDRM